MSPRDYIIESARRHGVDPNIALSVWQQESGGSTDLGLRGQTIERGKWKGHYARGPWQIMSFHGEIPNTFEGQTDWAMQHLKERGVRGYYGEGTPGVAGHPSTDQYEQQVLARAGRGAPAPSGGDRVTFQSPQADPYARYRQMLDAMIAGQSGARQGMNPLLAIGMGLLSTPTGTSGTLGGIGRGIAAGLGNMAANQPEAITGMELLKAEGELAKLEESRLERQRDVAAEQEQKRAQQRMVTELRRQGKDAEADAIEAGILPSFGDFSEIVAEADAPGALPESTYDLDQDLRSAVETGQIEAKKAIEIQEQRTGKANQRVKDTGNTFTKLTAPHVNRLNQWRTVADLGDPDKMDAVDDITLVKAMAKMMLPEEAVMSGDTVVIERANESILTQLKQEYLTGGKMDPDKRRRLIGRMYQMARRAQEDYARLEDRYGRMGEEIGLPPEQLWRIRPDQGPTLYDPFPGSVPDELMLTPEQLAAQEEIFGAETNPNATRRWDAPDMMP